jgi:hypothetical protein
MTDRQVLPACRVPALVILAVTQDDPLAQSFWVSLHD